MLPPGLEHTKEVRCQPCGRFGITLADATVVTPSILPASCKSIVYAKDTKMAPGRGCAATSALKESQRHHNAHKRAQTRQSHESPLTPLPPEQRSRAAIVRVLIIAVFVFRRAMEVDLLVEHSGAAVAVPEVDDRG